MNNLTIAIQRMTLVGLVILGLLINWAITGFAENVPVAGKSVTEIPSDIGRWMTTWKVLPETVKQVAENHGPVAAVFYGPAKGALKFARNSSEEAWDAVAVDQDERAKGSHGHSEGLVLRYQF